jgi:hypothetical protein
MVEGKEQVVLVAKTSGEFGLHLFIEVGISVKKIYAI